MGIFFDISIVMVDLDFSSQEKLVQINLNGAYGRKTIFHEHLLWKIKRVLKIGDCYVIFIIRSIYWKMRKGYLQNCRRFLYYHSFAIGVESHFYSSHLVEDVWIFCFAFKDTIRKNRKLWFYEKSVSFDLLPFRFNGKSSLVWYRVYTYKTNFRNLLEFLMLFYGTSVNLDHIKLLPPTFGYIVLVCHPQFNTLLRLTGCLSIYTIKYRMYTLVW